MTRVKRGFKRVQRRKRMLKFAKGFYGAKSRLYRSAKEAVEKALGYGYRDRKVKKREFRSLWVMRINAAARQLGLSYSRLMNGLKKGGIAIDRKMLADLAARDLAGFAEVANLAKSHLAA